MNHDEPQSISTDDASAQQVDPVRPASSLLATIPVRDEVVAPPGEMGRRSALKLMAASALLAAGTPGCNRKPYRKIISMVELPEYQRPGVPVHYASTWTQGNVPYGMMVKAVDGRPIKIEGLPDHPINLGSANAQMQASILSLYDPERLQDPLGGRSKATGGDRETSWPAVDQEITAALKEAKSVMLVTRASLGPSERSIVDRFLKACPVARHLVWESCHDQSRREAWKAAYGSDGEVQPLLAQARVILSLDADFLGTDGQVLKATRDFAQTRRLVTGETRPDTLSRLYVVESTMTVTGSNADHRIALRPSAMVTLVAALRASIAGDQAALESFAEEHGVEARLLAALASDLKTHDAQAVVLAGAHLPPAVHAAVCLLNAEIHAPGNTLAWNSSPANLPVDDDRTIRAAAAENDGVDVLIFLGVNPGHDWQPEAFAELIHHAKLTVAHGTYLDETLSACTLALPSTHNLESWNDRAPVTGLASLCQPVIAPIYRSRQEAESLLTWMKILAPDDTDLAAVDDWHHYVKTRWQREVNAANGDVTLAWEDALRKGFVGKPSYDDFPTLDKAATEALAAGQPALSPIESERYELVVLPHHAVLDGRFASNAWLEELPDPVSKLVWGNAATLGPATADALGVTENALVAIGFQAAESDPRRLVLPVLIQAGVADGVIVTTLGHGRTLGGSVGTGIGVNTAPLLGACGTSLTPRFAVDVQAAAAAGGSGKKQDKLVRTQKTFAMMDRPIVRHGTRDEYEADPEFAAHRNHVPPLDQLDPEYDYSNGPKWAMAIDLNVCTGCSACVVACQAENNIPVVGPEECDRGRIMQWMRIDRYEEQDSKNPHVYQQPMLCQHCDNAPCESVCPVNATAHSTEGLNEQAYNRCVGTRYCANNCPYKVRNFNYFAYQDRILKDDVQELVFNPQVTVRSRGVMEKCTFCIQRINEVKFQLENQGKTVPDGAIRPACEQSCPAQAIVFGNLNDPASDVSKWRGSSLAYHVLEELNVRPNVTYLARVTNPHPDLSVKTEGGHS